MGIAKMRTQLKGQILPLLERRGGQQRNITADNIALLEPKVMLGYISMYGFQKAISRQHAVRSVAEEGSGITPVASFQTILTVGTKIPLGEI